MAPGAGAPREIGSEVQFAASELAFDQGYSQFLFANELGLYSDRARILWPVNTPILGNFLNRWLAPFVPHLCLTHFFVARLHLPGIRRAEAASCSIIVPARNEEGSISVIPQSLQNSRHVQLIFVEGHSRDKTYDAIVALKASEAARDYSIKLLKQKGIGKADGVYLGFGAASNAVLVILDADLSVPPESVPAFVDVYARRCGDFINGVRLVYPLPDKSMRFANIIGNRLFTLLVSWVIGQPIKDALCGTKLIARSQWALANAVIPKLIASDPFGDFALLFSAAKLNLKIVDLPVRYHSLILRVYCHLEYLGLAVDIKY